MSDNPLIAAVEIAEYLSENGIRYALIGGLAVQIWGEPRLTIDADFTVAASLEVGSMPLVDLITGRFHSRIQNPGDFARKNRMILISASNGVDVDISLALPGYEDELLSRTVNFELKGSRKLKLCSPEDLIIHKAVAGRPQDLSDIQGIVYRQGEKLDIEYIRNWLKQFAELLEEPEIQNRFERAWSNALSG